MESFELINNFIKEIYGFDLIQIQLNQQAKKIKEIREAHHAIINILQDNRKPYSNEFMSSIYPLLEVAVQWNKLKEENKITKSFLNKCKSRFKTQGNFNGTLFEVDMASRFLFSNWLVDFDIEDYTSEGKQIDFVVYKKNENKVMAIECVSKMLTSKLTIKKINKLINRKSKKFKKKFLNKLNFEVDEKILIIDITRLNYDKPKLISDIKNIKMSSKLTTVIFTWREKLKDGNVIKFKYECIGSMNKYFTVTLASEFHDYDGKPFFTMRPYIEPEPQIGPIPNEWIKNE